MGLGLPSPSCSKVVVGCSCAPLRLQEKHSSFGLIVPDPFHHKGDKIRRAMEAISLGLTEAKRDLSAL